MSSSLEQLKKFTTVVADTGDFETIQEYKPTDATTNPSLIYLAASLPKYQSLFDEAIKYGKENGNDLDLTLDYLSVLFGTEILKIIPGRVSTEVDARLSYNVDGQVKRALRIIDLYKKKGIPKERILIKLSSTWEGIMAARELEQKHNIHCNLTLLFCLTQAIACAEAEVTLISPFVGRITDFYNKTGKPNPKPGTDPGVESVCQIYNYYKKHDYKTQIMGASFRNINQVKSLSGCDLLTISPSLLSELDKEKLENPLKQCLSLEEAKKMNDDYLTKRSIGKEVFEDEVSKDDVASFKLKEGIEKFSEDLVKLENLVKQKLN